MDDEDIPFERAPWDGPQRDPFAEVELRNAESGARTNSGQPMRISATPFRWPAAADIPVRPWVYGRWFLRRTVTAVIAPGGVGKSSFMAATALALASGRALLGKTVWGGAKRVWYWNLEDDGDELDRQMLAAAKLHNIVRDDCGDRLFVDSGLDGAGLCMARMDGAGFRVMEPVVDALVDELKRRAIDVLLVDPFISSHEVPENDNGAIDKVVKEGWVRVAKRANCSVGLVHHTKKLAGQKVSNESSDELIRLARKVDGGSDADLAEFRRAWVRHAAIQEQVTGATAEAGRALAQFKMAARANAVKGRVHAAMIEGTGGTDRLKEAAEMILDLHDSGVPPARLNRFAREAIKPTATDKFVELYVNGKVSGLQTHAVNILSNSLVSLLALPEMATAAAIGSVRRASTDRVPLAEISARALGLVTGARDGLRAFGHTLKTGDVPDQVTKIEARHQKAISGRKGEIIRLPTRLLAATDEFYKAIARNMEIRGLATRKAHFEGLKGEPLRKRVNDLVASPDERMQHMANEYARYLTFQRPLGPAGQSVMRFTSSFLPAKILVPFVRTPGNIFKQAIERSPGAPLLKEWRNDVRAGGARRDIAIARSVFGTGIAMIAAKLATDGLITGSGPMDRGSEAFMRADGWQPYSVKIGDQYYSYQRLDPLATSLGVAADIATKGDEMTEKQTEEATTLLVASIMSNLSDKIWLSNMSDLVGALEDPERNSKRFIGRLGASLTVPAISGQTARTIDPTVREAREPLDFIKAQIPGLSDDLPAKRDVWGREIVREGGVGPDIMSPIWTQSIRNDALNAEMRAAGVRIGPVPRQVGGRELTRAEHDQYRALSGSIMEGNMRALIESPAWKVATIEEKQDMADDVKKRARKEARDALFGGYRKASAKPPGLEMPDDVSRRIFTGPQAPPPPEGFTVPVSPPQ